MYTYHTFSSPAELIDFLNGTIVGRPLPALEHQEPGASSGRRRADVRR